MNNCSNCSKCCANRGVTSYGKAPSEGVGVESSERGNDDSGCVGVGHVKCESEYGGERPGRGNDMGKVPEGRGI